MRGIQDLEGSTDPDLESTREDTDRPINDHSYNSVFEYLIPLLCWQGANKHF